MKNASEMSVEELKAAYERIQAQKARRKAKLTEAQLAKRREYGKRYRANRAAIEERAEQMLRREQALQQPVVAVEPKPPAAKQPKK
jgi:hypothetical protein